VLHVGKRDGWVTPELAEGVKTQLLALGKSVEVFLYEADHAFFNDTRAENIRPTRRRWRGKGRSGFCEKSSSHRERRLTE